MKIKIICAYSEGTRAIGKDNKLLWRIPSDLRRFKRLTIGNTVMMGRKTWESIGSNPLPNRLNIVLTRNTTYKANNAIICNSLHDLHKTPIQGDLWAIGGESVYRAMIPYAHELHLSKVYGSHSGDSFFPSINKKEWELSHSEVFEKYRYEILLKKSL